MWPFRRKKMSEDESLQLMMISVIGCELRLEPPKPKPKVKVDEVTARADRTLRELLQMVRADEN